MSRVEMQMLPAAKSRRRDGEKSRNRRRAEKKFAHDISLLPRAPVKYPDGGKHYV